MYFFKKLKGNFKNDLKDGIGILKKKTEEVLSGFLILVIENIHYIILKFTKAYGLLITM